MGSGGLQGGVAFFKVSGQSWTSQEETCWDLNGKNGEPFKATWRQCLIRGNMAPITWVSSEWWKSETRRVKRAGPGPVEALGLMTEGVLGIQDRQSQGRASPSPPPVVTDAPFPPTAACPAVPEVLFWILSQLKLFPWLLGDLCDSWESLVTRRKKQNALFFIRLLFSFWVAFQTNFPPW